MKKILSSLFALFLCASFANAAIITLSTYRSISSSDPVGLPIIGTTELGDFNATITPEQGTSSYTEDSRWYNITNSVSQHSNITVENDSLSITASGHTSSSMQQSGFPAGFITGSNFDLGYLFQITTPYIFTLQAVFTDSELATNTWAFCYLSPADNVSLGFPSPDQAGVFPDSPSGTISGTLIPGMYAFAAQMSSAVKGGEITQSEHNASLGSLSFTLTPVPEPSTYAMYGVLGGVVGFVFLRRRKVS